VDLGVALVACSEPAEVVQVSEAALDHPTLAAEARTMRRAAPGDHGRDAESTQQPAVLVVVIATIGQQAVGLLARAADLAGDRPAVQIFDQRDQLGDVVAVPAGEADRQRNAAGVDEQVVL
jgi:hypothetical protein